MANIYLGKDEKGDVRYVFAGSGGLFLGHIIKEGEPTDPTGVLARLEVIGVPPHDIIRQHGVNLEGIERQVGFVEMEHIGVVDGE